MSCRSLILVSVFLTHGQRSCRRSTFGDGMTSDCDVSRHTSDTTLPITTSANFDGYVLRVSISHITCMGLSDLLRRFQNWTTTRPTLTRLLSCFYHVLGNSLTSQGWIPVRQVDDENGSLVLSHHGPKKTRKHINIEKTPQKTRHLNTRNFGLILLATTVSTVLATIHP